MMAGIDMQHVPYRGAPLAVSTPTSLELLPGVPPISEFLPGFETSAFAGCYPPGRPLSRAAG